MNVVLIESPWKFCSLENAQQKNLFWREKRSELQTDSLSSPRITLPDLAPGLEIGGWRLGAGDWNLEIGTWRLEQ
jgi:hypothetical protein